VAQRTGGGGGRKREKKCAEREILEGENEREGGFLPYRISGGCKKKKGKGFEMRKGGKKGENGKMSVQYREMGKNHKRGATGTSGLFGGFFWFTRQGGEKKQGGGVTVSLTSRKTQRTGHEHSGLGEGVVGKTGRQTLQKCFEEVGGEVKGRLSEKPAGDPNPKANH